MIHIDSKEEIVNVEGTTPEILSEISGLISMLTNKINEETEEDITPSELLDMINKSITFSNLVSSGMTNEEALEIIG